jgi:predicted nucleic acid-binding protein
VTLLDAYALIAFVAGEPAAEDVEVLLRTARCGVTTVNFAEAVDVTRRVHRLSEQEIRVVTEPLLEEAIAVIRPSQAHAWRSAALRARYYDRRSSALSLADCLLLAAAGPEDVVATSDPVVARTARAEGIGVTPLPDTAGERP